MTETLLVVTHVSAGFTALLCAPVAMLTRKGGKPHRLWGRVYFWAMAVIFVTALVLLVFRPNVFLFFISVLSFYGAFSGVRSLKRKNPAKGQGASRLDYAAAGAATLAGGSFIVWGLLPFTGLVPSELPTAFSILGVVFGVALGRDALGDLKSFRRPDPDPLWWWTYHLERMVGSYLAAVTAFLVQNVGPLVPDAFVWLVWAAPGVLGGFGIGYWIRYYRKKFSVRASGAGTVSP